MDITIFLLLYKERMGFKIEFFRVLKDEIGSRMENILGKDLVRNICKTLDGIWRVCKDEIKLFPAYLKEFDDMVTDYRKIVHTELRCLRLDEVCM